ncbi:hypothetical protein PG996_010662 [Apiospora saccharicola]|uniref:Uncharacterized protein n=1 Tax=Apiospora saccharicola TaxID=335842 RepID=A0ABR1UP83_9PEZI
MRAEASNFAFMHDLSDMTKRALAAEEELGELRCELERAKTNAEDEADLLRFRLDQANKTKETMGKSISELCHTWNARDEELAEMKDANDNLFNDKVRAEDALMKTEAEREELRNAVIALLVENRRLQATQPGVFRRLRDTGD